MTETATADSPAAANRVGVAVTALSCALALYCAQAAQSSEGFASRIFAPPAGTAPKAPDGTPATNRPYAATVPAALFDAEGTVALWFKVPTTLRGKASRLGLLASQAITIRIEPRRDSVALVTQFGPAMTGTGEAQKGPAYTHRTLLTHLKGGRWYHAAWAWDRADAGRNGFFLDGIRQDDASPYDYAGHIRPAESDTAVDVGAGGVTVSALHVYERVLAERELAAICKAANHNGYEDEGVRFTGETFVPTDVATDRPVYETSFDDPSVLRDWRLEGGRRMHIADGRLILESDTKSLRSEAGANHLVCWLTREVPADFLLEFTVRPQNRRRGLNIVFFNARGLHGENIFQPPIQPRNGLFRQYHSGDLNNYHISYWSGGRGTANLRKNKGFYLTAVGRDLVYTAPSEAFQTVRVYKRGGTIRLTIDDVVALAYDDDGKTYGPIHTHSGWIGLRQMGHTHRCEYGHLKVYRLKPPGGDSSGR